MADNGRSLADRACAPDGVEPAAPSQAKPLVPIAKKQWPNHVRLGPLVVRIGSRNLAPWGFPRLKIGGLSFWSHSNNGDLHLAAYHPRRSITWLWYVAVTKRNRGYAPLFSREEIKRRARLFVTGNPYVGPPRWFHRFWQPDYRRKGQWHDYLRLPFGRALVIGHQEAMWLPRQECAPTPNQDNNHD